VNCVFVSSANLRDSFHFREMKCHRFYWLDYISKLSPNILSDAEDELFKLDSDSEFLNLTVNTTLTPKTYSMSLVATDGGNPAKSATRMITVEVVDGQMDQPNNIAGLLPLII